MTPRTRRQALVLAVVVVVAAVVAGGRIGDSEPAGTRGTTAAGRQASAARQSATPLVADVRLEVLKSPRALLEGTERDLFRFKAPPPRPAAPEPPPRAMPPPTAPPMPQGPPPPPPIALKFIGLVEGASQVARVAVLTDSRGSVFYGKEGDIIDGRYRVLRITPGSAELAYVDGQGRQLLRLSGQ